MTYGQSRIGEARAGMDGRIAALLTAVVVASMTAASCARLMSLSESPASRELRAHAEAGDAQSQYRLGLRYTNGNGVFQNYRAAVGWFHQAAQQGHAPAQYFLAIAYNSGRGADQDHALAVKWFLRAAENGHPRAQNQLANAFINGRGVTRDHAWAARWYGKAARQGHVEAQFSLGVANAAALGVERDDAEAYTWLSLAANKGHELAARVREVVAARLTLEQLARLDSAVDNWSPDKGGSYADEPTIRYVEHALWRLGYDVGSVDGVVGPRTRLAIETFQRRVGLAADGDVTPPLVERIRELGATDRRD